MTYTCIAKKGVHEIQETGLNEKQRLNFDCYYKSLNFKVKIIAEDKKKEPKIFTKSDLLAFHNEHISTTIEIGEKEVDNWIERKKM